MTLTARIIRLTSAVTVLFPAFTAAQSGFVDVGEARIYYEATGNGKPVILIHGWALNLRAWDDQVKALSPHFRMVAYDRRGFGRSTGRPDISADPGDLRTLLDTLGIGEAMLVGHSAGTQVAFRFTAAFPERVAGLVLYGAGTPPSGFPVARPTPPFDRRMIARQHGLDSMIQLVRTLPGFTDPRDSMVERKIRALFAAYSGKDLLEDYPLSGRYPNPPVEEVKRWSIPVLLIVGDTEAPYIRQVSDSLSRWMPKARTVVIAGGGHGVHFRQPDAFNIQLQSFIAEVFNRR